MEKRSFVRDSGRNSGLSFLKDMGSAKFRTFCGKDGEKRYRVGAEMNLGLSSGPEKESVKTMQKSTPTKSKVSVETQTLDPQSQHKIPQPTNQPTPSKTRTSTQISL